MNPEDQFTSIQWDRNDSPKPGSKGDTERDTIVEDEHVEGDKDDNVQGSQESGNNRLEEEDEGVGVEGLDGNEEDPSGSLVLGDEGHLSTESVNSVSGTKSIKEETSNVSEGDGASIEYTVQSSVSAPLRDLDSSSKPYISYLVTTKTNHPSIIKLSTSKPGEDGADVETKTRRRYDDFRFLHDCLINDFPQVVVPPLPSKLNFKYLTGDTLSTEFVNRRLHSLNRFIKFIVNHKVLSKLSIFYLFVSDSQDWTTFQKNLRVSKYGTLDPAEIEKSNGSFSPSVVSKVVNEDILTETIMNFLTPSKHKQETNKDILEISDKLKKLYENLAKLDKLFTKLNKRNNDLGSDYDSLLQQITKLALLKYNDKEDDPANNDDKGTFQINQEFKNFASSISYFLDRWSKLHKYIDESFLVTLKDCSKYIISLTKLIELLHNKKIDLKVLQDYLNKSKQELSGYGGGGHTAPPPNPVAGQNSRGIVNNTTQLIKDTLSTSATPHIGSSASESKVAKLERKIEQLESEISAQTQLVLNLTNTIINEEYPYWDKFNKGELKESIIGLCDEEINFYKGLVENWTDMESKLVQRLDDLK